MSRVVYSDTRATADQEALREAHAVRLVAREEEGTGVNALPGGTYGFTYSPGLPNAPLFAVRRYRTFEMHRLAGGEVFIIGFVTREAHGQMTSSAGDVTIHLQPEPEAGADTLVAVPYSRIRQHRQYAAPNQHGFAVTLKPVNAR
ncbi:MAG: hypothetical protein ACRD26_07395 [Vicinamibacterales bacterium]